MSALRFSTSALLFTKWGPIPLWHILRFPRQTLRFADGLCARPSHRHPHSSIGSSPGRQPLWAPSLTRPSPALQDGPQDGRPSPPQHLDAALRSRHPAFRLHPGPARAFSESVVSRSSLAGFQPRPRGLLFLSEMWLILHLCPDVSM